MDVKDFIIKKKNIIYFLLTLIGIYLLYFHNIGSYKLLDVDETRYVDMSVDMFNKGDFSTLYLNGKYFFEKPPLFFWVESFFFFIFQNFNEAIARIPIALSAIGAVFTLYFASLKMLSKKYALFAALICATSLEFIILSKVAILDMLLASLITISIYCGFMTFFVLEKNKKYFWYLFYIFCALALLAKGIPGVLIPFGVMFFSGIYTKKIKSFFKIEYFLPGLMLFFLIMLPWHITMLKTHEQLFFDEYIIKHHILRFLGSSVIHRDRPLLFYLPVILWGFFPWIFSFISLLIEKISDKITKKQNLKKENLFIRLNIIASIFILIFFSISGTKLITYILPIYPFLSVILASYWLDGKTGKMSRAFKISAQIFNFLLLFCGFSAIFANKILSESLFNDISELVLPMVFIFLFAGCFAVYFTYKNKKTGLFFSYVFLMIFLSGFCAHKFFNVDYKFGQNDLMKFAQIAKKENKNIAAYNTGKKYSLLYYSENDTVEFLGKNQKKELMKYLKDKDFLLVLKNKDLKEIKKIKNIRKIQIIEKGRKYILIKGY